MERNSSETNKKKYNTDNLNNNGYKIVSTSPNVSEDSLILNKSNFSVSTISIEKTELSSFNVESLITIEEAISYFFDLHIKPEPTSFEDYYKTIRYFMFNIILKKLFQKKGEGGIYYLIIEKFLNLQFLCILIEGIYILKGNNNNQKLYNTVRSCISSSHQNYLILCQIIINEMNNNSLTNMYLNKILQIIIQKSMVHAVFRTKDMFSIIDKKNKEILYELKNILNSNKTLTKLDKKFIPLSLVLKTLDKLSSNWLLDYCLKILGMTDDKIKEIKEATYLDLEYDLVPLYLPIPYPFLDKVTNNQYNLTIILNLDKTLIKYHISENKNNFEIKNLKKRPGLDDFLSSLTKAKCELIIFTTSTQEYVDPLIDEIEKEKKYFVKRLYRQHTVLIGDKFVKDISKLGRDLARTIIVDNEKSSFSLQKRNGILIKPFSGEENMDLALDNLVVILLKIIQSNYKDIRVELENNKAIIEKEVTNDL